MADLKVPTGPDGTWTNSACAVEARLRHLFAEQFRLRELLEATRAELDRVNAEVLQTQKEYCTSPEREEEYCQCLEKVLGFNPRISLEEIEAARRNPQSIEDFLAELDRIGEDLPESRP